MVSCTRFFRGVALFACVVFLQSLLLPPLIEAQTAPCSYNKEKPSIDSARLNFRITNYVCAEEELQALLALMDLDLQTRADAHVLLAAVYYAKVRDNDEKRNRVMEQFVAAFRAFRAWQGELDIKSPEFTKLMEDAQAMVDQQAQEAAAQPVVEPAQDTTAPPVNELQLEKKKKPWYKQWWAIGLGVGVVAAVVIVAAGGGGEDEDVKDAPLPGFPGTP
jgi:hypothetical protein